ncbi:MAG: YqeG family HAD IIIA-type phosphatase [Lachnospiraceae bacterium]|nr:YqeG family HAD IIIA-type phosphatase [Lachnospiraceae bacterium]
MLQMMYPDEYVESTYRIDFQILYQKGYRGILFDIDNTLVPHGAPADDKAIELFRKLKKIGFQTCLISNNKEPRVKSFCDQVDSKYIYKAGKPLPKGYLEGMDKMRTNQNNTLFVGDQIFTDVLGAKRADLYTILVKPIHPKEEIQIVLKRYLEKIVLFFYFRHQKKKRVEK